VDASTPLVRTVAQDSRRFRWAEFDLPTGARAALFTIVPLLVGYAAGQVEAGVLATLGALNLFMAQHPGRAGDPPRWLVVAAFANAGAFGLGTLIDTAPYGVEVYLVGLLVWAFLAAGTSPGKSQIALIAAVMLVVPVGLPGGTALDAGPRALYVLLGGSWGLLGALLPRWVPRLRTWTRSVTLPPPPPIHHGIRRAVFPGIVAATVAVGFYVGLRLDLVRDFWVMLTILVALRPDLAATFSTATMRILGTIAGAAIAYGLTVSVPEVPVLVVLLAVSATLTFATRTVNYIFYATSLTVFVIVLLELSFAGGPGVAVVRVVDTLIGGALALATGALLWVLYRAERRAGLAEPGSLSP